MLSVIEKIEQERKEQRGADTLHAKDAVYHCQNQGRRSDGGEPAQLAVVGLALQQRVHRNAGQTDAQTHHAKARI